MPLKHIDQLGAPPPFLGTFHLDVFTSLLKSGAPLPPVKMPRMVTLPLPFDEFLMASLGFLRAKGNPKELHELQGLMKFQRGHRL